MNMRECFCPECGEKINHEYRVSICGLFNAEESKNNFDTEYAFLNGEVVINEEKLEEIKYTEKNPIQEFFYDPQPDNVRTILQKAYERRNAMQMRANGFCIDIAIDDNFDDDSEIINSKKCITYYWIKKLETLLHSACLNGNRILNYLLSVDLSKVDAYSQWYNIDLCEYITFNNINRIYNVVVNMVDDGEQNTELQDWLAEVMNILTLLELVEVCQLNFRDKAEITCTTVDGQSYPTSFYYNRINAFLRICPVCGAHIAVNLGIFEQKIISLIGTPTSGKTTLINSIYTVLNSSEDDCVEGVTTQFGMCDPYYNEYSKASQKASKYKLADMKTNKGYFPALTITISSSKKSVVYTFVDVPGDYFLPDNIYEATHHADMRRMKVMKNSALLCVIMAAEQLKATTENTENRGMCAKVDDEAMTIFKGTLKSFKESVLSSDEVPVCFVITKADALKPTSYAETDKDRFWEWNDSITQMTENEINKLYSNLINCYVWNASKKVVHVAQLLELQHEVHKFIEQMHDRQRLLAEMIKSITSISWKDVPMFMISPFGFYAVKNIVDLSPEDKIDAFENIADVNIENKKKYFETIAYNTTQGTSLVEGLDYEDEDNEVVQAQKALGWDKQFILDRWLNYYSENLHYADDPYGQKPFLYWLFISTGLLDYVCEEENLEYNSIIYENRRYCSSFSSSKMVTDHIPAKLTRLLEDIESYDETIERLENEIATNKVALSNARRRRTQKELQTDIERDEDLLAENVKSREKLIIELDSKYKNCTADEYTYTRNS